MSLDQGECERDFPLTAASDVVGGELRLLRFSRDLRKRKDSVPVSMMCERSVIRSIRALHSRALGITWVCLSET